MNIELSPIGQNMTADSMTLLFSTFGEVADASIQEKGDQRKATLLMPNADEAALAVRKLNGSFVDGRELTVSLIRNSASNH
jgi:RNA recognition motif-containing protein